MLTVHVRDCNNYIFTETLPSDTTISKLKVKLEENGGVKPCRMQLYLIQDNAKDDEQDISELIDTTAINELRQSNDTAGRKSISLQLIIQESDLYKQLEDGSTTLNSFKETVRNIAESSRPQRFRLFGPNNLQDNHEIKIRCGIQEAHYLKISCSIQEAHSYEHLHRNKRGQLIKIDDRDGREIIIHEVEKEYQRMDPAVITELREKLSVVKMEYTGRNINGSPFLTVPATLSCITFYIPVSSEVTMNTELHIDNPFRKNLQKDFAHIINTLRKLQLQEVCIDGPPMSFKTRETREWCWRSSGASPSTRKAN